MVEPAGCSLECHHGVGGGVEGVVSNISLLRLIHGRTRKAGTMLDSDAVSGKDLS